MQVSHPTQSPHKSSEPTPACTRKESLRHGTRGIVYLEFIIVFIPVYIMFLGIVQMTFAFVARLVVQHAAVCAARAAVVILPDDPEVYANAPVNVLNGGGNGGRAASSGLDTAVRTISGTVAPGLGGGGGARYARRNNRMVAIHDAASIPLLSIAPTLESLQTGLVNTLSRNSLNRAPQGSVYNRVAMAITFYTRPNSEAMVDRYAAPFTPVTVRVTYLLHCGVPIVRSFMCQTPGDLQGPGANELSEAPQGGIGGYAAMLGAPRFRMIRAEATMPLQGGGCIPNQLGECR
jgi:hypothetical protein